MELQAATCCREQLQQQIAHSRCKTPVAEEEEFKKHIDNHDHVNIDDAVSLV